MDVLEKEKNSTTLTLQRLYIWPMTDFRESSVGIFKFARFITSQMSGKMCKKTKHSGDVCDSWKIDNDCVLVTAYYSWF